MLPFPRLVQYANIIDNTKWYDGTELIAFDSLNYNSSGFTDYVGNTMVTGTYVSGGQLPTKDNKPIFNGTGIKFNYAGYIARNSMNVSTWLNTGWTLDYWTCQSAYTSTMQLSCSPIAIYTDTSFTSYTNRFLIAEANGSFQQWNNGFTGTPWNQAYSDMLSTSYVHFAIVYDGNNFKVYTNGVLQQTIVKGAFASPTPNTSLTVAVLGQGGYQPTKFSTIERYRLRAGVAWNSNFDVNSIY